MIDYTTTLLAIIAGTLIPAYFALLIIPRLKLVQTAFLAALGVGLTLWFFIDTMGDAAQLDVNSAIFPFSSFGGVDHFAIIFAFLAGIATLALLDHFAVPDSKFEDGNPSVSRTRSKTMILVPIAVAAVMGIHGLGEGWSFASAASSSTTPNLIDAFGGWNSVISYPLHKFLEASIIATVYSCYVGRTELAQKAQWHLPVLGLLFGLTSVIGSSLGYYFSVDITYFYAFGATAALYATIRLVEAMTDKFSIGVNAPAYLGGRKFLALAIGFFLLYTAALFH